MATGATTVVWKEGMHFCAHTDSGQVMCDESAPIGKAFPSAPELLMASLGSCIGSVLVTFADRHDVDLEGMAIGLKWKTADRPYRIGEIAVSVNIPKGVPPRARDTLTRVANACLIHNTLARPPQIEVKLSAAAAEAKAPRPGSKPG
jgi:uncharacterized OsmC-like protein